MTKDLTERTYVDGVNFVPWILALGVAPGFVADFALRIAEGSGVQVRDVLPEPLDVPDHISNTWACFAAGHLGGMAAVGALVWFNENILRRETSPRAARIAALIGGVTLGTAISVAGEVVAATGGYAFNPVDIAYGVAASVLGASFVQYDRYDS